MAAISPPSCPTLERAPLQTNHIAKRIGSPAAHPLGEKHATDHARHENGGGGSHEARARARAKRPALCAANAGFFEQPGGAHRRAWSSLTCATTGAQVAACARHR